MAIVGMHRLWYAYSFAIGGFLGLLQDCFACLLCMILVLTLASGTSVLPERIALTIVIKHLGVIPCDML